MTTPASGRTTPDKDAGTAEGGATAPDPPAATTPTLSLPPQEAAHPATLTSPPPLGTTAALPAAPPVGGPPRPPEPAPPRHGPARGALPPRVGGYDILGELGRGGMGVVYKARDPRLKRDVALKMILGGRHVDADSRDRFRRETEAVARLRHPNIVQIYEVGDEAGQPYCALEFVDGGGLDRRLAGTPQPPDQAAALVAVLARAVQHAHEAGIVHRDLKPANILLASGGRKPPVEGGTGGSHPPLADLVPKVTDL